MSTAIKQVVIIRHGGVVEVRSAELHEGDEAEVTVVVTRSADYEPKHSNAAGWRRYAGAFNSQNSTAADNNRIDADLAAEYIGHTKVDR